MMRDNMMNGMENMGGMMWVMGGGMLLLTIILIGIGFSVGFAVSKR